MENLLKVKLFKNSKRVCVKWSDKKNLVKNVDTSHHNMAIITGELNNLLVVDVDIKNYGVEEMEKYYKEFGNIKTVIV